MKYLGMFTAVFLVGSLASSPVFAGEAYDLTYPFVVDNRTYELNVSTEGLQQKGFRGFKNGTLFATINPWWTTLTTSHDLGESWDEYSIPSYPTGPGQLGHYFFVTSQGTWLNWHPQEHITGEPMGYIWRKSKNEETWTVQTSLGHYPWLGSSSIDEHDSVIMYAEYVGSMGQVEMVGIEHLNVIRSTDDGQTWEIAFSVSTHIGPNQPRINHFHTLQVDPYTGDWYLSSGDWTNFARMWKSSDQGNTWEDITDPFAPNLWHRTTHIQFSPDKIFWGTDDHLVENGVVTGAALISSPKTLPLQLTRHGRLSWNEVRCGIDFGDEVGILFITENVPRANNPSPPETGIELTLVTREFELIPLGSIPVLGYFTSSRFGPTAVGNLLEGRTSFSWGKHINNEDTKRDELWEYTIREKLQIIVADPFGGILEITEAKTTGSGIDFDIRAMPFPGYVFDGLYTDTHEALWVPSVPTRNETSFSLNFQENEVLVASFIPEEEAGLSASSVWMVFVMMLLCIFGGTFILNSQGG